MTELVGVGGETDLFRKKCLKDQLSDTVLSFQLYSNIPTITVWFALYLYIFSFNKMHSCLNPVLAG